MRAIQASGCNYTFEDEKICEHVVFHRCLANRGYGKVAIYPALTNIANDQGVAKTSCVNIGEEFWHTSGQSSLLETSAKPVIAASERERAKTSVKTVSKVAPAKKQAAPQKGTQANRRHSRSTIEKATKASARAQRSQALKAQLKQKTTKKRQANKRRR